MWENFIRYHKDWLTKITFLYKLNETKLLCYKNWIWQKLPSYKINIEWDKNNATINTECRKITLLYKLKCDKNYVTIKTDCGKY